MTNKIILAVVAVVALGGGGLYLDSMPKTPMATMPEPAVVESLTADTNPAPQIETNPAPSASEPESQAPEAPTGITMAEVQANNSPAKCYSVVEGNVYNLTSFITKHPGGADAIKNWMCGKDGTVAFGKQHGGQAKPEQVLEGLKVGILAEQPML